MLLEKIKKLHIYMWLHPAFKRHCGNSKADKDWRFPYMNRKLCQFIVPTIGSGLQKRACCNSTLCASIKQWCAINRSLPGIISLILRLKKQEIKNRFYPGKGQQSTAAVLASSITSVEGNEGTRVVLLQYWVLQWAEHNSFHQLIIRSCMVTEPGGRQAGQ